MLTTSAPYIIEKVLLLYKNLNTYKSEITCIKTENEVYKGKTITQISYTRNPEVFHSASMEFNTFIVGELETTISGANNSYEMETKFINSSNDERLADFDASSFSPKTTIDTASLVSVCNGDNIILQLVFGMDNDFEKYKNTAELLENEYKEGILCYRIRQEILRSGVDKQTLKDNLIASPYKIPMEVIDIFENMEFNYSSYTQFITYWISTKTYAIVSIAVESKNSPTIGVLSKQDYSINSFFQ